MKILEEKEELFSILDPHVVKVELTIREDSIPEKKKKYWKERNKSKDIEDADKAVENFWITFK